MYPLITCVCLSYQICIGLQIALASRNGSKSYWDIINIAKMETLICSVCKTIPCFLLLRVVLFPWHFTYCLSVCLLRLAVQDFVHRHELTVSVELLLSWTDEVISWILCCFFPELYVRNNSSRPLPAVLQRCAGF